MDSITGGSKGSSSSSQGFRDLPPELQDAFKALAVQAQSYLPGSFGTAPGGTGYGAGAGSDMFNPMGETAGETAAIGNINKGFTPNAQQFGQDIAMQMNPFDDFVINEINREARGSNSILQSNLNRAGQFGSNRQFLGANDIDLTRLNQIGQFKQGQFNTAANNAMTVLPALRNQDASNQLQAGGFQRGLDLTKRQAPISALQAISQIINGLPNNSGTATEKKSSSNGLFSPISLF